MAMGPTIKMKKRLNIIVLIAIILSFVIVTGNLINISVVNYDFYNDYADNHQLRPEIIPANRGTVYDRNMQILAQSATVWDVTINPQEISDDERTRIAKGLSEILNVDENMILEKTHAKNQYEIIKRKIEKETHDKVLEFITNENKKIEAENKSFKKSEQQNYLTNEINLVESTKRYYPNSTLASSLLGFTGTDSQGLYGIEVKYDEILSGTPGYIVSLKNALSENIPNSLEEKYDPIDGNNLVLTIDETIQHFVEKTLTKAMAEHNPKKGCCAIVMNVKTGAILAMANKPNFNCNDPFTIYDKDKSEAISALPKEQQKAQKSEAQKEQWNNKSISYAYQPGSTFKTIVASAALEEKTDTLKSTFYCPGFVKVGDRTMKCHKAGGHGTLDFAGALVNSCNPSFVQIGANLGPDLFFKYLKGFGITERTGIDLPGEGDSVYYDANGLRSNVSLASCSFGQSLAITPIQLITAVSAITNGGYLMKPYVVKDVLDSNNNIVNSTEPVAKRQVISEETSKTMCSLMEQVVVAKGGTNAYVKGYRIGGKSGTSQKQNPGDDPNARIGSYVAVAPINDPEIAVLVMIDEPQSGEIYGSVVAAPVTASIMSDTLPYLGYSPKYTAEEAAKMDVTVPLLVEKGVLEAESKLAATGLGKPKIIGNGKSVVKQVPSVGSVMPRDGTVIIYTDDTTEQTVDVPNVVGLKPSIAKQKLENKNLNVIVKGIEGNDKSVLKITSQNIASGKNIQIGTVIEITCVQKDAD